MVELKVVGGRVVDPRGGDPVPATVLVDRGRVVAVGEDQPATRELDARGTLVLPGLVDAHDHLRDLTPGLRLMEGLTLDALLKVGWRRGELAEPAEYRVGAALTTARLLKSGVTSVVDHLYPLHRELLVQASIEGYQSAGIRWFMARGVMTKPYEPICETADAAFASIEALLDSVVPKDRLFVAPVSFRQAEPEVFTRSRKFADEHDLRLYTHVAETELEVAECQRTFGARPVELLHKLGFVGPDTTLVHCVKLSEEEVDLLAATGTNVVHCPSNNMRLAKGVTRVPALMTAGVNVCLGVDGMGDILSEMRQELYLQSLETADPAAISVQTVLQMATVNGARAVGKGDRLGLIEAGRDADLICVDLSSIHLQPVVEPLWTLVNRATRHDVRHVVVEGKVVVQNGSLTLIDEQEIIAEAQEVSAKAVRRAMSLI